MNHKYAKGDIVEVDLGKPDTEAKGHEQAFTRPCVVIKSFDWMHLLVIVPCTTTVPKHHMYTQVALKQGAGGLTRDSYALCHQIRTVSHDRIVKTRGRLDNTEMLHIHAVLMDALEL